MAVGADQQRRNMRSARHVLGDGAVEPPVDAPASVCRDDEKVGTVGQEELADPVGDVPALIPIFATRTPSLLSMSSRLSRAHP